MAKSGRSALLGRSPGFRIFAGPAPSRPIWTVAHAGGSPITVAPPQRIFTAFPICVRFSNTTGQGWPCFHQMLRGFPQCVNTGLPGNRCLQSITWL